MGIYHVQIKLVNSSTSNCTFLFLLFSPNRLYSMTSNFYIYSTKEALTDSFFWRKQTKEATVGQFHFEKENRKWSICKIWLLKQQLGTNSLDKNSSYTTIWFGNFKIQRTTQASMKLSWYQNLTSIGTVTEMHLSK